MLGESVDVDSEHLALSDLEASLGSLRGIDHEVLHLLVVNLAHHRRDLVLNVRIFVLGDSFEDFAGCKRDYSLVLSVADHGVTLAGSGLAVGKQASVVALPGVVQDLDSNLFKDVLLVLVVGAIEWKGVSIISGPVSIVTPEREIESVLFLLLGVEDVG
jgi:hypothetical protein